MDPTSSSVLGFSHVGICVSDLDLSTAFYCGALGFREMFTTEMGEEVAATMGIEGRFTSRMLGRGDLRVELLHWEDREPSAGPVPRAMDRLGVTHLCMRVDDVGTVAAAAVAAGGSALERTLSELPGAGPDGGAVRLMYLLDPDGVRIECMQGAPDLAEFDRLREPRETHFS